MFTQQLQQFDQIGWTEFDEHHASLDFLGDKTNGRGDDDEFVLVEAMLVDVPKTAADFGRFAQRLVEILEMEDAGSLVGDYEIENSSGRQGCGRFIVAIQALRKGPGPHGRRRGQALTDGVENVADALLLGGTDVCERPSRFKDLPQGFGGTALCGFGRECGWQTPFGVLSCLMRTLPLWTHCQ